MDSLSQLLALLKPRTYNCGGLDLGAASALHFPRHEGMKCYAVVSGAAWLAVEGLPEAVHLEAGHCILLSSGRPFRMAGTRDAADGSHREAQPVRCGTIAAYDGGGGCLIVGAHYAFPGMQAAILLGLLPPLVHLRDSSGNAALRGTLQQMTGELRDPQPGGLVVAHALARMMLVQALRAHLQQGGGNGSGWLAALADGQMRTAIASMHDRPAHAWTVEELARLVGMSRSAFSLKFKAAVGQSPMEYLTCRRMLLAEDRMDSTADPVSEIARSLGYGSASAFAKVFRRLTGHSPRQFRSLRVQGPQA